MLTHEISGTVQLAIDIRAYKTAELGTDKSDQQQNRVLLD